MTRRLAVAVAAAVAGLFGVGVWACRWWEDAWNNLRIGGSK